MGYSNPPIPWSEFERRLSDARRPSDAPADADGGDSPAWSVKRHPYRPAPAKPAPETDVVPYAELHAHSNFSFLDGASSPEELLEEASALGLSALALTDHDGFYGSVRLAEAAEQHEVRTVFGAELSLGLGAPQNGVPDPEGSHLLLLARGAAGYHEMSGLITEAQLAAGAEKGRPEYDERMVVERLAGRVVALTGCRKGRVRVRRRDDAEAPLRREGEEGVVRGAVERVAGVEQLHHDAVPAERVDEAVELALRRGRVEAGRRDQRLPHPPLAAAGEGDHPPREPLDDHRLVVLGATLLRRRRELRLRDEPGHRVAPGRAAGEEEQVGALRVGHALLRGAEPERQLRADSDEY